MFAAFQPPSSARKHNKHPPGRLRPRESSEADRFTTANDTGQPVPAFRNFRLSTHPLHGPHLQRDDPGFNRLQQRDDASELRAVKIMLQLARLDGQSCCSRLLIAL
jgi:hypothetical protein